MQVMPEIPVAVQTVVAALIVATFFVPVETMQIVPVVVAAPAAPAVLTVIPVARAVLVQRED